MLVYRVLDGILLPGVKTCPHIITATGAQVLCAHSVSQITTHSHTDTYGRCPLACFVYFTNQFRSQHTCRAEKVGCLALLQRHSPLLSGPWLLPPTSTLEPSAQVRTSLKETGVPAL
jgi:hypothetical protein